MTLRFVRVSARRPTLNPSTAFSRMRWMAVPVLVGVFSGCQDDPSDPLASLVSAEIAPAVAVPVDLPSLGELAQLAGVREELGPVLDGWVAEWVIPDSQARSDKRLSSSMATLRAFYDAILPQAPRILEYLDQHQLGQLAASDERLLKLMLSFAEVIPAVEFYQQPSVIDGYSAEKFKLGESLSDLSPQM